MYTETSILQKIQILLNMKLWRGTGTVLCLVMIALIGTLNAQTTGEALHFESGNHVEIPNLNDFPAEAYTIQMMCFFDTGVAANYKTIFHLGSAANSYFEAYTQGSTRIAIVLNRNAPNGSYGGRIIENFPLNEWFLLTIRYDAANGIDFSYNGIGVEPISQNTTVNPPAIEEDCKGYIGFMPSNSWATCCPIEGADELRIWNVRLSDEEVNATLNCQLSGNEANLYAYYSFNQGLVNADNSGENILIDQGSNGKNGNLIGFSLNGTTSNWTSGSSINASNCTPGCSDESACNYDPSAAPEELECTYPDFGFDCEANLLDSDGDGVFDVHEGELDTDGDGLPDFLDPDDDGDGVLTQFELGDGYDPVDHSNLLDSDSDGLANYLDPDDDGDGIPTIDELGSEYDPTTNTGAADTGGNGIPDYLNPVILIEGCTNPDASNYLPSATVDDGSCAFSICGDGTYYDIDLEQCLPVTSTCDSDINGDGQVNVSDLLLFLGSFGSNCN